MKPPRMTDIAAHLERAADLLPDRVYDKDGNLLSSPPSAGHDVSDTDADTGTEESEAD